MRRTILRQLPAAFALLIAAFAWAGSGPSDPKMTPVRAADVADTVRSFIGDETHTRDGLCRINDPVENATLNLRLKDVYAEKLMKIQPDTFITCAFFESADGTSYDVDFYVKGTTRQNLKVVDVSIHSKNGIERYAWADDKGFMRVKAISSKMPMREELAH